MEPSLNGQFREVVSLRRSVLEYHRNCIAWAVVWISNKVVDIGEWSVCEGGRLAYRGFIVIYIFIYLLRFAVVII